MDRPGGGVRAHLLFLLVLGLPFLHVRFNAPDASILPRTCRPGRPMTRWSSEFPEGEFASAGARRPDRRARDRPGERRPRSTTGRDGSLPIPGSAGWRASWTSIRGSTGSSTSCSCRIPRDRRTGTWPSAAADHGRRRDRVHGRDPLRPQRRRGPRAGPRPARSDLAARAAAGLTVLVGGGAAEVVDVVDRIAADIPRTVAVHPRHDLPDPVPAAALGGAAGQGAGHEHALDPGQLRGPGLDLPGRQPVGAARLRAAGLRGDHDAGDPVLRPVRAVDGLRGVPAQSHEGGVGPRRATTARRSRAASSGAAGS